jgi:hypothetical protein
LLDQNKFSLKKIGASIWLLEPLLGKAPQRRSLERLFPERGWKPITNTFKNISASCLERLFPERGWKPYS